jgi:23S rRNA (guanosine2251-2'-O)-methyltransferase
LDRVAPAARRKIAIRCAAWNERRMPERWDPRNPRRRPARAPRDKDKSRFAPKPKPVREPIRAGVAILYGWHTVAAALANPQRRVRKITATENAVRRLADEGLTLPVTPDIVRPEAIAARLSPDAVHQGLLVEADPLPSPDLADLEAAGTVLVLDQITDPHNVGAILRTAAAFAVKAIVTTARHSPEATGVLAKAASGALELVPVVTVQNLARALTELKERGFLIVGLDSEGETDLSQGALREPLALVLGAEGKGLRQLTRQTCDIRARLDLPGAIKSLNVSNAAAVALYAAAAVLKASSA